MNSNDKLNGVAGPIIDGAATEVKTEQPKLRNVMLAAPSYDGSVSAWHVSSLVETAKIGLANGINIVPIYMSYDALVQRARNDIFQLAYESKVDDLVFIDCDQDWDPSFLFRLLGHDVPIVGAPVVKKSDQEAYNVKSLKPLVPLENGLCEVDSVGTGFLRIRADAVQKLWEVSLAYKEPHKETHGRMVFDVKIVDGELWSEDVVFCQKWKNLGGKIFIDPSINPGHSGFKRWAGNFTEWYNGLGATPAPEPEQAAQL